MKWRIKSMTDPGDGIVTETIVEHVSDDIVEVCADAINGEIVDEHGDIINIRGWVMGAEALPPEIL